jgi:hypothetical protein
MFEEFRNVSSGRIERIDERIKDLIRKYDPMIDKTNFEMNKVDARVTKFEQKIVFLFYALIIFSRPILKSQSKIISFKDTLLIETPMQRLKRRKEAALLIKERKRMTINPRINWKRWRSTSKNIGMIFQKSSLRL